MCHYYVGEPIILHRFGFITSDFLFLYYL